MGCLHTVVNAVVVIVVVVTSMIYITHHVSLHGVAGLSFAHVSASMVLLA